MGKQNTRTKSIKYSVLQPQIHNKTNHHSRRGSHLRSHQPIIHTQKQNSAPPKIIIRARINATTETLQKKTNNNMDQSRTK